MRCYLLIISVFTCLKTYSQSIIYPNFVTDTSKCQTLLWGIVNKSDDTSYLFGTFHEFGNVFFDKNIPLREMFMRSNCIVTESIVQDHNYRLSFTTNWVKSLSKSQRREINDFLKKIHSVCRLKDVKKIPPSWLVYSILQDLIKSECKTTELGDVVGIDEYIMNSAITNKKNLLGLESIYDTFNIKNKIIGANDNNDITVVSKIYDIIEHEDLYRDSMMQNCSLATDYRNYNINYNFLYPSVKFDSTYKDIVDVRNDAWMTNLMHILDNNKTFVAVGLGHLMYEDGLIMQLIKKHYVIFPVSMHLTNQPLKYVKNIKVRHNSNK